MPQLCIPRIGSVLVLAQDWTFKLYPEHRNTSLVRVFATEDKEVDLYWSPWYGRHKDKDPLKKHLGEDFNGAELCVEKAMTEEQLGDSYATYRATNSEDKYYLKVTLPKGIALKIDRIYIRNGVQAFDSVTFRIPKNCPEKRFRSVRFWAKLSDVNNIVYDALV